jgi:hypothetical protein
MTSFLKKKFDSAFFVDVKIGENFGEMVEFVA